MLWQVVFIIQVGYVVYFNFLGYDISQKACMFAHFYIYFLSLSFTGGPRLESGTGAVSGAAEESIGTTRGADERDFPLHVMT